MTLAPDRRSSDPRAANLASPDLPGPDRGPGRWPGLEVVPTGLRTRVASRLARIAAMRAAMAAGSPGRACSRARTTTAPSGNLA